MTIATRNRFIRVATVISLALVILSTFSIIVLFIRGSLPLSPPGFRPLPFLNSFFLTPYSSVATVLAISILPFFSLTGLVYILFSFEKTQSVEITFFAACVFATSFEAIRLFIPFYDFWLHSNYLSVTITRFVFFSRIFSFLALLSSAIFATGKTVHHVGPSIFLLAFLSFSLANAIPINSATISSIFLNGSGYKEIIGLFFVLLAFLSMISYYILGKTYNIPEYSRCGTGIIGILLGYGLLTSCDSWLFFFSGSLLLAYGAYIYLKSIHRFYLWQ